MPAMFALLRSALAALAIATPAWAQTPPAPQVTVFVGATIVPMDTERTVRGQTVIVRDGKIAAIGPGLPAPAGARVIEARGAYLSPGLADMHTHAASREALKVYLAHGVTTVLNMGGASSGFMGQLRPAVNEGRVPGPHIFAALQVDGTPRYGQFVVATPEDARDTVRLAKANGYSFIKVYNTLAADTFQALIEEGRAHGLPVVGHTVESVGLERQVAAGQLLIAHTEEFLYSTFADPDAAPGAAPDPAAIPAAIAFLKRSGTFVTADLVTYAAIARQWGKPEVEAAYLRRPEVAWLDPAERMAWRRASYKTRPGSIDARLAFLARFTKAMSEAGVPLVAGTDAPSIPGLFVGASLHEDLAALRTAGLTPYQALATATKTPGELIARGVAGSEPFGRVAVGHRADLILTKDDPLADLAALRQPLGVMAAGRWYDAADLDALLDGVEADYRTALTPP